jgi:3-dehydroquinate synthase
MGGGLVTNLGGLAASLTMRGIRFYYVPTTLTGQIDASMGSKQAVNYRGAKNWLGIFNDPELCYINPHFLSTISRYEFNSQAIEGLKLCLATDKALFFEVSEDLEDLYHATIEDRFTFLEKMIMAKLAVLREDLTEENYGMCMLYGHTIGHAVEMLDHENISHGEGVGLGMLTAARLSYMLGIADRSLVEVHRELLSKLGLPTKIPSYLTSASIIGKLSHNKKNYEGKSHFVLLKGIGQMSARNGSYHTVISHDLVSAALEQGY